MSARQTQKGFTIIEVVLVLAIAGLIFLMVFVALPALQSGQRDGARKNDVSAVSAAITQYSSNNRGGFPTTTQLTGNSTGTPDSNGKFGGYLSALSANITEVTIGTQGASSVSVSAGQIRIIRGTTCGSSGAGSGGSATQALVSSNSRSFTVTSYLEAGGGTSYCQDS